MYKIGGKCVYEVEENMDNLILVDIIYGWPLTRKRRTKARLSKKS